MSESRTRTERDVGALLLRLAVGGLMLFHGVDKLVEGIAWLGPLLAKKGLPSWLMYGVYAGEILAPILLLLGVATRSAAGLYIATMGIAVYLVHADEVFALGKHGEYALELHVLYAVGAAAIALWGPGRFAVPAPRWARQA
jgi:putative oxidoreductase